MIRNKADLDYYLSADQLSLVLGSDKPRLLLFDTWRFQRLLRRVEYFLNCRNSPLTRPYIKYLRLKFHYVSVYFGFTIPPNVFGPGLNIHHHGHVVVNANARVGKNCCLQQGVNIGRGYGVDDVPSIGDNVYLGPGAKIFGRIVIANDIAIGANAVVNRSFTEPAITIAGVPARKISNRGSAGLIIRGTELLARRGNTAPTATTKG